LATFQLISAAEHRIWNPLRRLHLVKARDHLHARAPVDAHARPRAGALPRDSGTRLTKLPRVHSNLP